MGSPSRMPILAPPRGFRDILPTEARELRAIERALDETFASYGYVPIEPPMVERVDGDSGLERERLMQFLDRDGSLVALRPDITTAVARLVADAGMRDEALGRARNALSARGRAVESIDIDGVDELREVIHLARDLFAGEPLWGVPNLSLVPALPYYTGVVFEALHPKSGFPIAAGGRYDLLLGAFGTPRRATGFAISVPRLHLALFESGWRPARERSLVSLAPAGPRETAQLAATLRARGVVVAIGAVAERAGLEIVDAAVVDRDRVRMANGRVLSADELARELS